MGAAWFGWLLLLKETAGFSSMRFEFCGSLLLPVDLVLVLLQTPGREGREV